MKRQSIRDIVRGRRKKLDITAEQAAKKLGLSVNYYRLIEGGYPTHVSERVAGLLTKKLGVSRKPLAACLDRQNRRAAASARKYRNAK